MSDIGSFMPRMLQELVKCKEKRKKLEEAVMILKLENQNLQIERGTLQGRVNMLQAKHYGDILLLQEQLQNAIIEAEVAKQSFGKKTAELDAKLKAAETGRRVAEEELADWKKGLERLEKLCEEVVGEESEDDDSASGSAEFERAEQVFENLTVGQPLDVEIIDLTQADDDDGKESDTTRGIGDVGVNQAEFVIRDTFKKEPDCHEENTENNDVSNNGNTVDVPDWGRGDAAEVGIGNCDVIITEQPPQIVNIKSEALDLFGFQIDGNENDGSNNNQEAPPGTTISHVVSSNKKTTKSKAIIHERDYSKEPRIFCRCGKEFLWITKLNQHLNNYNNRRFCCKLCEKRFRWGCLLRYHLLRKHNATMVGGSYSCGKCGGQFATRGLLFKHQQRRKHRKSYERSSRGRVIEATNLPK
ncbi:unnamed protein product [Orchesella dallaii]|uniref:C2H2-type domain-containing protein n=1 Tax=Orchesella dallaii TaxID=48710 RepID=A0ABP1RJ11_9HEXA